MIVGYDRTAGLAQITKWNREPTNAHAEKVAELRLPVTLGGYSGLRHDDAELISGFLPHLRFAAPTSAEATFDLVISVDRWWPTDGVLVERDHGTAVTTALRGAHVFLVALSMATFAIVTWRRIDTVPSTFLSINRASGVELPVLFKPTGELAGSLGVVDAGHLATAVDLFAKIGKWPMRFHSQYQKGEMFLAAPEWPVLSLAEESYLCFFKCLEHAVMARYHNRRGQMSPRDLAVALEGVGAKGADLPKVTAQFIQTRGRCVAHMLKGYETATSTRQDAYELKKLLDLICRGVAHKEAAARMSGAVTEVRG